MYKLLLLPFVLVIGPLSAQSAEPSFKPDYSQRCNPAITQGAQNALDKTANEFNLRYLKMEMPSDRISLNIVRAGQEYSFVNTTGDKYLELMSYAEKKYKCALRVIMPTLVYR